MEIQYRDYSFTHSSGRVVNQRVDDFVADKLVSPSNRYDRPMGIEQKIISLTNYLGWLSDKLVERGSVDINDIVEYLDSGLQFEIVPK